MKRILSVTFPELETITGVFTKSTLRLLTQFASAYAIRTAGYDAIVDIVISRSKGRKSSASVQALIDTATSSVGVASITKDLILKQEASLLLHLQKGYGDTDFHERHRRENSIELPYRARRRCEGFRK
jgi:mevalonate kinase